MKSGDACALIFTHRAVNIDNVSIPCIGVGDDRNGRGAADMAKILHHLCLGNQPHIRVAVSRGGAKARDIDRIEPGVLHRFREQCIVNTRRKHHALFHQLP